MNASPALLSPLEADQLNTLRCSLAFRRKTTEWQNNMRELLHENTMCLESVKLERTEPFVNQEKKILNEQRERRMTRNSRRTKEALHVT